MFYLKKYKYLCLCNYSFWKYTQYGKKFTRKQRSYRVGTGPWKPGKSWNLKILIPGLQSPGIFVEVLESPGIWTYRSIFLIISVQEFSHYTSSEIWVYLCLLKVCEFIEKVPEFHIGRSWNLICQNVYEPWVMRWSGFTIRISQDGV